MVPRMPIKAQSLSPPEREQLANIAAWARQAIAFAMSIRNSATTSSFDDPKICRLGAQEAEHLTEEIWEEAAAECATLSEAVIVYAEKVFDWCYVHMKRGHGESDPDNRI